MVSWLLDLIGVSDELSQRVDELQWFWARPTVFWVGLALLAPTAWFIVRRHRRSLPYVARPLRGALSFCRVGVLALLLFVLAGPYLRLAEPVTHKSVLAVLIDESQSMDLPVGAYPPAMERALAEAAGLIEPTAAGATDETDATDATDAAAEPPALDAEVRRSLGNMTRSQLVERVLSTQAAAVGEPLHERFELRVYRFARDLRRDAWPNVGEASDSAAAADEPLQLDDTALGTAVRAAAREVGNRSFAGLVVLSDGRSTTGPDPQDAAALMAGGGGAPVWAVPIGSPEPMADVSLLDVLAPAQVALGDHASIVATVDSHGFASRSVRVTLREGDAVLDETTVVLEDGLRQQAQLAFEAERAGARLLTLEIETLGEEQVTANNRQDIQLHVSESQWKVLYLAGYPNWDFRFLDHTLRRDRGLDVTLVMEAALRAEQAREADADEPVEGEATAEAQTEAQPDAQPDAQADAPRARRTLPEMARLPEDAAGFAEYDLVVLGDVSPELLPRRWQEQLAKAVREEGVGLIVQAGPQYMPHGFAAGPLEELLPTALDATPQRAGGGAARSLPTGLEAPAYSPFRMVVTAPGSIHPALRLYDSATRNREVWSQMPTFYWAAGTGTPRPGATVLAELRSAQGHRPLIAEHFAGRGRVLLIGMDSTYTWRRNIGEALFYRFWGQAMRHIARPLDSAQDESWVRAYPARVEPGEPVAIELFALDGEGHPLAQEQAELRVADGRDVSDVVQLQRGAQAGHYRGQWTPAATGAYAFTYRDAQQRDATAGVHVAASGRELLRPSVDRHTLGTLGDLTGGGLLELAELGRLTQLLEGEPTTELRVHEEEVWDNWLTLVLLVSLYCTDVFVRRLTGVV